MPRHYAKRSAHRRGSRASSLRKIAVRKPSARNQKYQIASLARRVNRVTSLVKDINYTMYYKNSNTHLINSAADYYVIPLMNLLNWEPMFGGPNTDPQYWRTPKIHIKYLELDTLISANNESNTIVFTCFLATPKDQRVVGRTGGSTAAACGNLTADTDYCYEQGITYLNPKCWTIHKKWRLRTKPLTTAIMTAPTVPPTVPALQQNQMNDMTTGGRYHTTHKMNLKLKDRSTEGAWNSIDPWDLPPSQRPHLFLFNNDRTEATNPVHPRISWLAKFTATTSAR